MRSDFTAEPQRTQRRIFATEDTEVTEKENHRDLGSRRAAALGVLGDLGGFRAFRDSKT